MDPKHSHGPDRIDYQEKTGDLTEVHAALQREKPEPTAETTPFPLWLMAVCLAAMVWAGSYLGLFHGGLRGDVFNERLSSPGLLFPDVQQGGGAIVAAAELSLADQGKSIFSANCQACHQATGAGLAGQFPPLVGSEWVVGSEKRMVAILLKGIQGQFHVKGVVYNGNMPPWEKTLTDKKIAAVITYVRSAWGNTAPEVSEAKVTAGRAEMAASAAQMTEGSLKAIPDDATLPDAKAAAPATPAKPAAGAVPGPAAAAPTQAAPAAAAAPASAPAAAPAPAPTPADMAPAEVEALMAVGKTQYMTICVACHQPTGGGLPSVFPPLIKSEYVNGAPERLVGIILKGVMGAITVDGKLFNMMMPAHGMMLTDDKIAAVATYVRKNFQNDALPISPAFVKKVRAQHAAKMVGWTEAELKAFPPVVP